MLCFDWCSVGFPWQIPMNYEMGKLQGGEEEWRIVIKTRKREALRSRLVFSREKQSSEKEEIRAKRRREEGRFVPIRR